jgi:hypothetical protein
MNPEHKRIVELANGWEGSDAVVTLSPADAALLKSVGATVTGGTKPTDPAKITGRELFAAGERLKASWHETPEGANPTPNQQSVTGPGTDPEPGGIRAGASFVEPEDLDALTVAELKAKAEAEGIDITGHAKKADIVAAIRLARGE